MKHKRVDDKSDGDMDSIDNMTSDDIFLPQAMQPHVTINESPRCYDTLTVKRENNNDLGISQPQSPNSFKGSYRKFN